MPRLAPVTRASFPASFILFPANSLLTAMFDPPSTLDSPLDSLNALERYHQNGIFTNYPRKICGSHLVEQRSRQGFSLRNASDGKSGTIGILCQSMSEERVAAS